YVKSITAALRAAVVTKPPPLVARGGPAAKKGRRRSRKEGADVDAALAQRDAVIAVAEQKKAAAHWGLLEPLHPVLGPLASVFQPFVNAQVMIAVLVALLLYTWLAAPPHRGGSSGVGFAGYTRPERVAAYEEIWRREESALWEWLEDRAGLDGVALGATGKGGAKQKALGVKSAGRKLERERGGMEQRQMDDAIRTTEERLQALKEAVARKRKGEGV
ncbi:hypothetical protein LTR53_015111, partial [Teratosphaeriaceae sp. CCFEE 6253]